MQNPFDNQSEPEDTQIKPGIYSDLSNAEYHSGPGISKSGLDLIAKSPSLYQWNKTAPVDEEKTEALDFGTALHCWLLEPDIFHATYTIMPKFNLRTAVGQADKAEFLEVCKQAGQVVVTEEDSRKLSIMRDSVMAHPVARMIFEADGVNEASIYWIDPETGELCRIRPDRMTELNGMPFIVDVKKIDGMDRFRRHVLDFRYDVQAAMYVDGYEAHFGFKAPFLFLAVSSTVAAGRYPVGVFQLSSELMAGGYEKYRTDLNTYHQCRQQDAWLHIQEIK